MLGVTPTLKPLNLSTIASPTSDRFKAPKISSSLNARPSEIRAHKTLASTQRTSLSSIHRESGRQTEKRTLTMSVENPATYKTWLELDWKKTRNVTQSVTRDASCLN